MLSESYFSNLLAFAEVLLKFHSQSPSLCRLAALSLWHSQAQLWLLLTILNRRDGKAAPGDRHLMAKKREGNLVLERDFYMEIPSSVPQGPRGNEKL